MIHDISLPITESLPVYPGDPKVSVEKVSDVSAGAPYSVTKIAMGSHAGTHVDAPSHLLAGGSTIDNIDLDLLLGPCLLVSADGDMEISIPYLERLGLPSGTKRLILRTKHRQGYLSQETALRLVEIGIGLVGIDSPSLDAPASPDLPVHRTLLRADIVIVENLALDAVKPGRYWLACLPLKIEGCDGAPARVVLMDEGTRG